MGEYWIGKALKVSVLKCFLLLLCLCMISTAIFLWYVAWCELVWDIPTALNAVQSPLGDILFS